MERDSTEKYQYQKYLKIQLRRFERRPFVEAHNIEQGESGLCYHFNVVQSIHEYCRPRAVPRKKGGTADNTSRNEIRTPLFALVKLAPPLHKHYLYPIGTVNVVFIYKINIQSGNYL